MPSDVPCRLYYTHNLNPRVAVAVARHLDSPVEYVRFDPMGVDQAAARLINPNTLAPVLVEGDTSLWETDAIAYRLAQLADSDFWPADRQAEVLMWVSWSAHHFTNAGGAMYFENIIVPQFFDRPPDRKVLQQAEEDFRRFAAVLDATLADRTWLIGENPSYADFRVASTLPFAERAKLPLGDFSNIANWHDRLNAIDAWREPFAGLA
jgi:glutathione S-transferase